jgi:DNA-binding transcriptional MerR regulator
MTTAELAQRAGTTKRTIRYYLAEGLLPPAGGTSTRLEFQREHELRLRLIQHLQTAGIKLGAVKGILDRYSLEDVENLVDSFDRGEHPAVGETPDGPSPTAGILREVPLSLVYGTVREPRTSPIGGLWLEEAPPHEEPVLGEELAAWRVPAGAAPSASSASPASPASPASSAAPSSPVLPASPASSASPGRTASLWHRICLADEVEMLVRAPVDPERKAAIEEVVAYGLERLASNGPPEDPLDTGNSADTVDAAHPHPSPGGDSVGQPSTPTADEEAP